MLRIEDKERRHRLYGEGLGDREIARIEGISRDAVKRWRTENGLAGNLPPPTSKDDGRRREMYDAGYDDAYIARIQGCNKVAVRHWRVRRNLPANRIGHSQSQAERAARMLLYSFGYSDSRIAKEQGVHHSSIWFWRQGLGLVAQGRLRMAKCRDAGQLMLQRIKRALPAYLSPADRDDAASNLFLAVMSGDIPILEIEKRAGKFGSAVMSDYASKFGPRSLNEELGDDGDGFTMMDTLIDERSSSWLEEMGATVW